MNTSETEQYPGFSAQTNRKLPTEAKITEKMPLRHSVDNKNQCAIGRLRAVKYIGRKELSIGPTELPTKEERSHNIILFISLRPTFSRTKKSVSLTFFSCSFLSFSFFLSKTRKKKKKKEEKNGGIKFFFF